MQNEVNQQDMQAMNLMNGHNQQQMMMQNQQHYHKQPQFLEPYWDPSGFD